MEASAAAPPSPSPSFLPNGKKMESPSFSPGSDKRFWSSLRNRVDTLLESKSHLEQQFSGEVEVGEANKRLSDDTALLLRGFDSVAHTLSQLSSNIDSALQGAKELSKPPTMTDILKANSASIIAAKECVQEEEEEEADKGRKRKLETEHSSSPDDNMLKKAKNLAVSMATKASYLAKELKSMKSDLSFTQERCVILEEENEKLRHGFNKGIQPEEEDDLVRFQLEALLAEKSRLANENANLKRENQCLKQVVEYHQVTSQDLSDTYEEVINGMCLDFSSPPLSKVEGDEFDFSARSEGKGCEVNENEQQFDGLLKYSP